MHVFKRHCPVRRPEELNFLSLVWYRVASHIRRDADKSIFELPLKPLMKDTEALVQWLKDLIIATFSCSFNPLLHQPQSKWPHPTQTGHQHHTCWVPSLLVTHTHDASSRLGNAPFSLRSQVPLLQKIKTNFLSSKRLLYVALLACSFQNLKKYGHRSKRYPKRAIFTVISTASWMPARKIYTFLKGDMTTFHLEDQTMKDVAYYNFAPGGRTVIME